MFGKKIGLRIGFGMIMAIMFLRAAEASDLGAQQIIQRADEIRNPGESYIMRVEVLAREKNALFEVFLDGNDKTLIKTLAPERDRGRNLLMLAENMWAYLPNLKRPVRVSIAQKLNGDAANGDVARMRWGQDYQAQLEQDLGSSWIIFLRAQKKGLTYDQIRVWIEKNSYRPLKAEYLTVSGKVIKTAQFQDYRLMSGKERPTLMVIEDSQKVGVLTKIVIKEMQTAQLPAAIFRPQNM